MNIGIDLRPLLEKNLSGIGQYSLNLLSAIFKQDKNNKYYLFLNGWRAKKKYENILKGENVIWVVRNYPNKCLNFSMRFFHYPKLDKLSGGVDVWWSLGNNFISWSNQTRKVITCHDLSWRIMPRFYSVKGRFWHALINLKDIYRQADVILAISENTKNDLIDYNSSLANKIIVTPLGVKNIFVTEQQIKQVKNKFRLPDKFLLYVGNIEPRKNIDTIVDVFFKLKQQYPDLYLVIAGGQGWHQGYYKRILKRISGNNKIFYLGYVKEMEKYVLYNLATVFLFPSFYEGFGLPPLEAMSQGLPVVASAVSSLPEVIQDGGLLVDPHNIGQIIYAVDRILKDENLRQELISKGKQISDNFNWEKTAKQTLAALGADNY